LLGIAISRMLWYIPQMNKLSKAVVFGSGLYMMADGFMKVLGPIQQGSLDDISIVLGMLPIIAGAGLVGVGAMEASEDSHRSNRKKKARLEQKLEEIGMTRQEKKVYRHMKIEREFEQMEWEWELDNEMKKSGNCTDLMCVEQPSTKEKKASLDIAGVSALSSMNEKALREPPILIGREKETDEIINILLRKERRNPLLVGEAGVGKTLIMENLAHRMAQNDITTRLQGHEIFEWDLTEQSTNTQYVGQSADKAKKVLDAIEGRQDVHLFADEIHAIYGIGSSSKSDLGLGDMLKPYLARNRMSLIGATTPEEYEKHLAHKSAFDRRFQVVEIPKLTQEQVFDVLKGIKKDRENYYGVKIPVEQLKRIIDGCISGKHQSPSREIQVLDNAMVSAQRSFEDNYGEQAKVRKVALTHKEVDSALMSMRKDRKIIGFSSGD